MKAPNLAALTLFLLVALTCACFAQDNNNTSGAVESTCAHWAKLRLDKHKEFKGGSNDVYDTGGCYGYFKGLMDGMDNTGGWQLQDGTLGTFQIDWSQISSTWDVIQAFEEYVESTPLAKGKPAWNTLQHVLIANKLGSFAPQTSAQASNLTDECKAGVKNVLNEFNADNNLKTIDTETLSSSVAKLLNCWNTPHLSDVDVELIASATAEAQAVLISRAMNVLTRNSLLPQFSAERSGPSSANKTLANIPSATEQ